MGGSVRSIAEGVCNAENANDNAQIMMAEGAISMAPSVLDLQQEWVEAIQADTMKYVDDTYKIALPPPDGGPQMAAVAAEDNEQKSIDQTQSDQETSGLQNIVEILKSNAQSLGSSLDNAFKLEQPILDLLSQTRSIVEMIA